MSQNLEGFEKICCVRSVNCQGKWSNSEKISCVRNVTDFESVEKNCSVRSVIEFWKAIRLVSVQKTMIAKVTNHQLLIFPLMQGCFHDDIPTPPSTCQSAITWLLTFELNVILEILKTLFDFSEKNFYLHITSIPRLTRKICFSRQK